MKIALLGIFALFFVMLVSGCSTQVACNPPYIVKGSGCCLDQNYNRICDSDETGPGVPVKTYGAYKVVMYIQQASPEPDSWSKLPSSPARHYDGYQIYSYPQDDRYYDGGWLLLYSSYTEEPITCNLKEYHDSFLYKEENVKLTEKGYSGNVSGVSIKALYDRNNVPYEVKYEIACTGDESGITFQDTYVIRLRPP